MSNFVKNLVTELPKSPLPAGYANAGEGFTFFVSGPKPLECDKYIIDGEAIVLSTGGNAAVHYGKGKFSYSTDCWALQPVENDIEGKYLYYFLSFQTDRIDALGFEGSGLKHLRKDFVRNYEVPDLSKPEQSKIAEVLSKVDQALEQTESLIAKQQRIKAGLMQDLLTRGIDEHGNLRSEETHEFKDSLLGRIPVEWTVASLIQTLSRLPKNGIYKTANQIGSGTLLIGQTSFTKERRLDYSFARRAEICSAELNAYCLSNFDILVTRVFATVEGVGLPVLVTNLPEPAVYESNMLRLTPDSKHISPTLLFYWLLSNQIRRRIFSSVNASNQTSVNQQVLNELPIPIAPISEQRKIVNVISTQEERIQETLRLSRKLRSLKTALMQDLLTGKKQVTPLMENMEVCS